MELALNIISAILAYLIGSIPTELISSRWFHRKDIRKRGDGNMGARNTNRQFGFGERLGVAVIDIMKGLVAVWLAMLLQRSFGWQLACAGLVILGNDFPIFAGFRGGQGLAVTTGVLLVFFPAETFIGFVIYLLLFLIFRNSDIAASIGLAAVVVQQILNHASFNLIAFTILVLLFIPTKKWMDRSRRMKNQTAKKRIGRSNVKPRKAK